MSTAPDPKSPTRLALWLAGQRMPRDQREFQLGDLVEEFHERLASDGDRRARRWLWRQALRGLTAPRPARLVPDDPLSSRSPGVTMHAFARDLGFALRLIRRTPLVSAAAILTFALGIGANVAVFSVAWPALGARLPFPDEERLAFILLSIERNGRLGTNPIAPGDYFDISSARSFESIAGFNMFVNERNLITSGDPRQVRVASVTEDFFEVLGVPPIAGRPLNETDFTPDSRALALTERLWRQQFDGDPAVIGSSVTMDGASWTIVGVMPDATTIGTIDADAWSPQLLDPATARPMRSYFLAMIGRLRPGTTLDAANAELRAIMLAVAERYPVSNRLPSGEPLLARGESFRERLTGPVRPTFMLLIGGAAVVLVIAGINLAGLQIARHVARRQELSVRRALGAARGALVRQLTLESVVLGALGGLAGLAAAALTLGGLSSFAPVVDWLTVSPRLTAPVVGFTIGLTLLAGAVVGIVPALLSSASRRSGLDRSRGGTESRGAVRMRSAIVGAQVATTLVLLIAATLTAASLARVLDVDPGFEIDRGLIADVRVGARGSEGIRFYDELVTRAAALPGVEHACAINHVPLDNVGGGMTFVAEGQTDAERQSALPMGVTDDCFEALRIPLVAGRSFRSPEAEGVAIVNESMARALWPDGSDPVGKRIHIGLVEGALLRVVGVVKDIRASALESSYMRQVWMSASRAWPMPERLVLRTSVPPETLAGPVRRLLRDIKPDLALANVRTMDDIVGQATASRRFVLALLGGFAAIAVALAAVGIYGMLAYQVGQRTREIGIRIALGASRAAITRTIATPVAIGVIGGVLIGLAGARLLSSLIATQLFEMSATDARVYAAAAVFVLIAAAVACWAPARRARRVSPVVALRSE